MDFIEYYYETGNNRLNYANDGVGKSFTTDLGMQAPNNYDYTELGELETDRSESSTITWTPDGKVRKIELGSGNLSQIEFYYDTRGDRVAKIGRSSSTNSPVDSYTIYHRDAAGNVLAIYDNTQNEVKEGEWICVELNYECALPSDQTVTVCIEPGKWYEDGNKIVIEDFYVDHPDPQSSCNDGFYSSLTFNKTDNSYLGADPNPTDIFSIESWNIETRTGGSATEQINLAEWHLYGSSAQGRVATVKPDGIEYANTLAESATFGYLSREVSEKFYEIKDHLGNVRLVFSDLKKVDPVAPNRKPYKLDLASVNNYYPFGMLMPENNWQAGLTRYGFNGYENDNEWKGVGNALGTPFRPYDPRIGRWMEPDPIYKHFQSNYVAFRNNPIYWVDPSGMDDAKSKSGYDPNKHDNNLNNRELNGSKVYENEIVLGVKAPRLTGEIWWNGQPISKEEYNNQIENLVEHFFDNDFNSEDYGFNLGSNYNHQVWIDFYNKGKVRWGSSDYVNGILNPFRHGGIENNSFELVDWGIDIATFGTVALSKETIEWMAKKGSRATAGFLKEKGNYLIYTGFKKKGDYKRYFGKTFGKLSNRYNTETVMKMEAEVIEQLTNIPNDGVALGVEYQIFRINGGIENLSNIITPTNNPLYQRAGFLWLEKNVPDWQTKFLLTQ